MENRIALIGVIVENPDSVEKLNALLHKFAPHVIGRMGLPLRGRGVSLISVALDAPEHVVSALAGRIGALPGVGAKTVYSKAQGNDGETERSSS